MTGKISDFDFLDFSSFQFFQEIIFPVDGMLPELFGV